VVGRAGLEPATFCASGIMPKVAIDWQDFRNWLNKKYSKTWVPTVFSYAKKYHGMLNGSLTELDAFSKSKRNNVLKALIALSKYLGIYKQFKTKIANYGIKWENQSSVEAFLRIRNANDDVVEWAKACISVLDESKGTLVKFTTLSGLRKGEAINAFNMIIRLHQNGKLDEYYNSEFQSLEHFKYPDKFLRGTKNAFFSFMPKQFIEHIATCQPISYESFRKRLNRKGLTIRLNELRDYYGTFMVHNGLIREEVDILQGRVGKSIFMRHYFSPNIKDLRDRTLKAVEEMARVLS